jgi:hypothetical protein
MKSPQCFPVVLWTVVFLSLPLYHVRFEPSSWFRNLPSRDPLVLSRSRWYMSTNGFLGSPIWSPGSGSRMMPRKPRRKVARSSWNHRRPGLQVLYICCLPSRQRNAADDSEQNRSSGTRLARFVLRTVSMNSRTLSAMVLLPSSSRK